MSEQPPRASGQLPRPDVNPSAHVAPDPEPQADREERIRRSAGARLDEAADAARRLGHRAREHGGVAGRTEPIAYRVGDSLQSAASYVREHDLRTMRDDVEDGVRASPLKALALAAAAGFLVGRIIR